MHGYKLDKVGYSSRPMLIAPLFVISKHEMDTNYKSCSDLRLAEIGSFFKNPESAITWWQMLHDNYYTESSMGNFPVNPSAGWNLYQMGWSDWEGVWEELKYRIRYTKLEQEKNKKVRLVLFTTLKSLFVLLQRAIQPPHFLYNEFHFKIKLQFLVLYVLLLNKPYVIT